MHRLLLYPDHPFGIGEIWGKRFNPQLGRLEPFLVTTAPDLSKDFVYAKERKLIEDIRGELRQGRRCQVYATFTGEHDVAARLESASSGRAARRCTTANSADAETRALVREAAQRRRRSRGRHPKLVKQASIFLPFQRSTCTRPAIRTIRCYRPRAGRGASDRHPVRASFVSKATTQTTCLRSMGKKMLVALIMRASSRARHSFSR